MPIDMYALARIDGYATVDFKGIDEDTYNFLHVYAHDKEWWRGGIHELQINRIVWHVLYIDDYQEVPYSENHRDLVIGILESYMVEGEDEGPDLDYLEREYPERFYTDDMGFRRYQEPTDPADI